ncbi:hypothetical protein RHMOL_Rhmol05G0050800 [Rhododendron molle]|uniref:Uncharacterized protein n=1 Tax=Rhododendron molle TaxID=49168 RepID=A0ACC0NN10_RHOML|nr:hypothetical protein RHMOL_Rhmol05G0050800 [Rhododendron molle]
MYNLDLRFAVPALLNLILSLLQHLQEKPCLPSLPNLNMNWNSWFFAIVPLIPFCITSFKLPLSLTADRIRVRVGDFSFFLAITLFSSVFLPQLLFWYVYAVIICVSPWHGYLSELLAGFLFSVWDVLYSIPVLIITCIVQNHQQDQRESETPPPPQIVVVADDDIGGNPILLEQPTAEPNTVVVGQP